MDFKKLDLISEILRAVEAAGYTTPTPIQEQVIPLILSGQDVMASAQTGTGKTASFTLPILQRLMGKPRQKAPRALILVPTRELAAQVYENVKTCGRYLPLRATVLFGGVSIHNQLKNLRQGNDLIIATAGRLLDHVHQKSVDLSKVETLVLDEADRMLDMGFIRDIRKLLPFLPKARQTLLFSATFSPEIKKLAAELLHAPKIVETARENAPADLVAHKVHPVDDRRKRGLLSHLLVEQKWKQVLVFTRTKHSANRLAQHLSDSGLSTAAIHGNKSQAARTRALFEFKKGTVQILVATDIAARGLDIDRLPHVVNFELPNVPEDYIHRIGRTGRAGREGHAISLVCVDERPFLRDIERLLKRPIPSETVPGYEPDPSIKGKPILIRGGRRR